MNHIVARLARALIPEPAPDPVAVRQGLTVRRIGWGRYQYSGLPAGMRGRPRRRYDPTDPLDRLFCGPAADPALIAHPRPETVPVPGRAARELYRVT